MYVASTGVLLVCYWCATGVLLVCYWCATGVLLVCYWCATGVLLVCYWCAVGDLLHIDRYTGISHVPSPSLSSRAQLTREGSETTLAYCKFLCVFHSTAPVYCGPSVCLSDKQQAVPHTGVSQWWVHVCACVCCVCVCVCMCVCVRACVCVC